MLISYKVGNFCSFDKEAEFDLLAPANKVKNRFPDNYTETDAGYDILKTAVIIGENAGGKTNFINSLSFFKSLFENNKGKYAYKSLMNVNRLLASSSSNDTQQEFELCVLGESGTIYHYYLQMDELSIVQERLSCRKEKGGQGKIIFMAKREQADLKEDKKSVKASFDLATGCSDKEIKKALEQMAFVKGDMGLFITKLAILGEPHSFEFVNWVTDKLVVESKNYNYFIYKNMQNEEDDLRILRDPRFLDILRMVDYSIDKIEIDEERPFAKSRIIRRLRNGDIFSRELDRDSGGVGEFFAWAVQIFRVVYEDRVVFADEMDRVINPVLAERIVAFINGKKHRGQFVFSSHNVLHLDLKNYMKEQIYFVTKNREDLNSELYSLADFPEIRYETTKIYEFYMKGILGGTAFE